MKKLHILFFIAFIALSNTIFASEHTQIAELIPEAKEQIQRNLTECALTINNANDNVIATRSYTDPSGKVWQAQIMNFGPNWYKYFKFGEEMATWEDLPYFEVAVVTSYSDPKDGMIINWYQGVLFWPSKYALGLTDDISFESAEPATINEIINSEYKGLFRTMKPGETGKYDRKTLGMINGQWFRTECLFNGTPGFIDKGSRLTLSNYVSENNSIGIKWQGSWSENGAETTSGQFAVAYDGEAFITVEKSTYKGDFTHLHIYDFGQVDHETYPGVLYELPFEPLKMYRILAHNEAAEVDYGETSAIVPSNFSLNPGYDAYDISYVFSSAYADLNAESPVGEYRVQELKAVDNGLYIDNVPEVGTMLPGGYSYEFSRYDGTKINYHGNEYPVIAESVLKIGESTFVFDGHDMYGNEWKINFPVCYIHSDRTDYTKCEEILSGLNRLFGDKDQNMITKTANGVNVTAAEGGIVSVYSTTGALVKIVNAIAGEQTSIELDNGIYIIRVGKTATKVII